MSYRFLLTRTGGGKRGFTLIEMLVVIGMITIVTAIALPSLRGIYQDFRIRQTLAEVDTFISSLHSYCLIMNDFPTDSKRNYIKAKDAWCLPRNFHSVPSSGDYKFTCRPYMKTSGGTYCIDKFSTSNRALFALRDIDKDMLSIYKDRIQQIYPRIIIETSSSSNGYNNYDSDDFGIPFLEIDGHASHQYR